MLYNILEHFLSIVVVVVLHFDLKSILKIDDKDGGIRPVGRRPMRLFQCFCGSLPSYTTDVAVSVFIIIHSFYIALFSALEQTHCAHWHVILNEYPDCILL